MATDERKTAQTSGQEELPRRFRVIRFHKRGGLGCVYVGYDEELNREVAIKGISPKFQSDEAARKRFEREIHLTADLQHPGIVQIYGKSSDRNGVPYYAMRFVDGETLKDAVLRFHKKGHGIRKDRQQLAELLDRFISVCHTIAFAHSRKIVHRDIKPDNVLLGPFGETVVVDWGLAHHMDDDHFEVAEQDWHWFTTEPSAERQAKSTSARDQTEWSFEPGGETIPSLHFSSGLGAGTLGFMSPEQIQGTEADHRSDVYSLGATLYFILTSQPPFDSLVSGRNSSEIEENLHFLRKQVCRGEFKPPHQINRDVDSQLEAICLKAMATRPEDRYDSAEEIADDVQRWLVQVPVQARPERWTEKIPRLLTRYHQLLLLLLIALMLIGVVSSLMTQQRSLLRDRSNLLELVGKVKDRTFNDLIKSGAGENIELAREVHSLVVQEYVNAPRAIDPVQAARSAFFVSRISEVMDPAERAIAEYQGALELISAIKAREGRSTDSFFDDKIAEIHHNLAVLFSQQGKPEEAFAHFESALRIRQQLYEEDPESNAQALARIYGYRGDLEANQGQIKDAISSYVQSRDMRANVFQQTGTEVSKIQLARAWSNFCNLSISGKDYATALRCLQQTKRILGSVDAGKLRKEAEELYLADLVISDYENDLATCYVNFARCYQGQDDGGKALASFNEAKLRFEGFAGKATSLRRHRINRLRTLLRIAFLQCDDRFLRDCLNLFNELELPEDDPRYVELNAMLTVVRVRHALSWPNVQEDARYSTETAKIRIENLLDERPWDRNLHEILEILYQQTNDRSALARLQGRRDATTRSIQAAMSEAMSQIGLQP